MERKGRQEGGKEGRERSHVLSSFRLPFFETKQRARRRRRRRREDSWMSFCVFWGVELLSGVYGGRVRRRAQGQGHRRRQILIKAMQRQDGGRADALFRHALLITLGVLTVAVTVLFSFGGAWGSLGEGVRHTAARAIRGPQLAKKEPNGTWKYFGDFWRLLSSCFGGTSKARHTHERADAGESTLPP